MLKTDQIAALMSRTALLQVLDEADRLLLAERSRVRSYRRGQVVFFEGDDSTSLVIVASGRLKVTVASPEGGELLLNIIGPDAVIGDVSVVDGGPRSASAETLDDSEIVLVPVDDVRDLMTSSPDLMEQMLQRMAELVRRLTGTTSDLVFLDLPRRVAKLIVTASQDADGGGVVADLRLTQGEIGARLGASRQSVNTALRNFARRGLIEIDHQQVRVLRLESLAALAGGRPG